MKIVISYLSSIFDKKTTIKMINRTNADGIHVDLTDGIYAGVKNFEAGELRELFKDNNMPIEVHMMVSNPLDWLDEILALEPACIYFHPKTVDGLLGVINKVHERAVGAGIVINTDENINEYEHLFPYVDRVLLMSVPIGYGGQKFDLQTKERLDELLKKKYDNHFLIYVDGGINDETIKEVTKADGVVSGSFVCKCEDMEGQINKLRDGI